MTVVGLSWAYLRDRPLNTVLNIVLLALGAATVTVLLLFSHQMEDRLARDARGVDLVVGAKGSPLQLILSSLYHVDIPTGNIPLAEAERLARHPQVAAAIPLALGDSFRGFRLVGTEPSYPRLYAADLAQGRLWQAANEATVGAEVARRLGMGLGQRFVSSHGIGGDPDRTHAHDDQPYTVVGVLAPTGSVVDRLILTSVESIWAAHGVHAHDDHDVHGEAHDHHEDHAHHDHDDHHGHAHDHSHTADQPSEPAADTDDGREITALLIRYRSALGAVQLPRQINDDSNLLAAVPAVEMARLLSLVGVGLDAVRGFAVLLMITAGLGVFVALSSAMAQRRYDVAMLRAMGASRATVLSQVLIEGMALAGIGAVVGIALGHGVVELAARTVAQLGDMGLTGLGLVPGEGWIIVGALAIGAVAAVLPAVRAYRVNIADTLAGGA